MYVRTKSVLDAVNNNIDIDEIDINNMLDNETIEVIKNIYNFQDTLINVTEKNETLLAFDKKILT